MLDHVVPQYFMEKKIQDWPPAVLIRHTILNLVGSIILISRRAMRDNRYCFKTSLSIQVTQRSTKFYDKFSTVPTGGVRQNLFEIYYFEKLHAPRARGARARARAAREVRPAG